MTWTPEDYFVAHKQTSMVRPPCCPHCSAVRSLAALGYYERWLSGSTGKLLRLSIRRFRCRVCGHTVSLLPDFAQPYRLVRNVAIERYFSGGSEQDDVRRQILLLRCYWWRFINWLPELSSSLGASLGRSPPASQPKRWWKFLLNAAGNLSEMTRMLVGRVRVTIFGRYECHQPRST